MRPAEGLKQGAYVLNPQVTEPELILMATGSELQHIVAAEKTLAAQRPEACGWCRCRAGSCSRSRRPSTATACLPPAVKARLAVEAGVPQGWRRWVGDQGATITIDHYGASAPYQTIMKEFGFTPENVAAQALKLVGK